MTAPQSQVAENFRWDGQVMGLECLINHRRFEGLENVMRVRKQIQKHREWARKGGGGDPER